MRDLAYDLAENAAKIRYDDLPADVVEITKKFILDTLATLIAGSSASGCDAVVEQVKPAGLLADEVAQQTFTDKGRIRYPAFDVLVINGLKGLFNLLDGKFQGPFGIDVVFCYKLFYPINEGRIFQHKEMSFEDKGMLLDYIM